MAEYAYVFSMFLGDLYIPGAMVLAYSIFKTDTKYDVVVMVTPDVSEEAKDKMKHIGIKVENVEYINTNAYLNERPSMRKRYPNIGKFSTKWNCLKLIQYKKVFLMDVDMMVAKNMDSIFELPTPATRMALAMHSKNGSIRITSLIFDMDNGDKLPKSIAKKFLYKKNGTIDGGCMLLTPNMNKYNKFLDYTKQFDPRKFDTVMTDDEFALFSFYVAQKKSWHYLGIEWSCQYRFGTMCSRDNSYVLNYMGLHKPWLKDLTNYSDLNIWYEQYDMMKKEYPELVPYFGRFMKS